MRKIKVAIVDTGFDTKCEYLSNVKTEGFGIRWEDGLVITKNYDDYNGHGTACASVIYRECNEVELFVVNAMGKVGKANSLIIEHVLKILQKKDVDIINMSFAMPQVLDNEIYNLCEELKKENKILVAADSNIKNKKGFPACFNNVYGVQGKELEYGKIFEYDMSKEIQCLVNNIPMMCADLYDRFQLLQPNNSIATAKFTGILCDIIYHNNIKRKDYGKI